MTVSMKCTAYVQINLFENISLYFKNVGIKVLVYPSPPKQKVSKAKVPTFSAIRRLIIIVSYLSTPKTIIKNKTFQLV